MPMMPTKNRIAFGSCNDQDSQNNLWPVIESREPAAFIFGGDAIYSDYKVRTDYSFPLTSETVCATPERLKQLYRVQKSVPGYRRLLDQNITTFGTFDDHDYGCNNADSTYEYKYESGLEYVNFLGEPKQSGMYRRARAGLGVYGVKLFDFDRPVGQQEVPEQDAGIDPDGLSPSSNGYVPLLLSNQTVAVFVLDVRTNKTPWKTGPAAYRPDYEGDFLGERQWAWFETAIRRSPAAVNVIVNGLQVHANRFPNGNIAEAWGKYPTAQQRLFNAVLQDGVGAPILISGDVHMAQFSRRDCVRPGDHVDSVMPRPLIEFTTSGMTHSWGTLNSPPRTDPKQKPTWKSRYESLVAANMMRALHALCPWTDLMKSSPRDSSTGLYENGGGEGAGRGLQFSLQKNFGELEFDWEDETVSMRAIGENSDAPLLMAKFSMDQLSGREYLPGGSLTQKDFASGHALNGRIPVDNTWTCINHRGQDSFLSHMFGHAATALVLTVLAPAPFLVPAALMLVLVGRLRRKRASRSRPLL